MLAIAAMAVVLLVGFAGMGYRAQEFGGTVSYPLFGAASTLPAELDLPPGWYYAPSLAIPLAAWTVFPSLLGWAAVRWIWVPFIAKGSHTRENALAMARHLSGVYLYVYLMIFIGAVVMFLLSGTAPLQTGVVRTWLWCFLFGESFFVPALMWWRLVANDSSGTVFGRLRYAIFGVYLLFFVVTPLAGMCMEVLG